MSCPQISSHVVSIRQESPEGRPSRTSRRRRPEESRSSSFSGGNPSSHLASRVCGGSSASRGPARSLTSIPGLLSQAQHHASAAAESDALDAGGSELNRGVEAYNAAVLAWRTYELSRSAGSPPSGLIRSVSWSRAREQLLAAAELRGYRLRDLEDAPSDQLVFRPSESGTASPRMSQAQVSSAVLRLTRIRNRIRELDRIEDDFARPMTERLRAAASAVALVRQAAGLVERIRAEAPNPRDPRILRLSSEILHAACDDPNTATVASHTDPEWVASTARLYQSTARGAIDSAFQDRGETGTSNRVLLARLHLLRARRASLALTLSNDPATGARIGAELQAERVGLQRDLLRQQSRIVRDQVREANRLLARADAVLGRPHRRVSAERLEAARADYRRGREILLYLSELSTGDSRVSRLRQDRRWARLESAATGSAA